MTKKLHTTDSGEMKTCDAKVRACPLGGADREFPATHEFPTPDFPLGTYNNLLNEKHFMGLSAESAEKKLQLDTQLAENKYTAYRAGDPKALTSVSTHKAEVDAIASKMHEDWQKARNFEPRMKDDGNGGEIDIANTPYSELPAKWKEENHASAAFAVESALKLSSLGRDKNIPEDDVAEQIHIDWLVRNGGWAEEHQKVPYSQLSEDEKEKDRIIARQAIRAIWGTPLSNVSRPAEFKFTKGSPNS